MHAPLLLLTVAAALAAALAPAQRGGAPQGRGGPPAPAPKAAPRGETGPRDPIADEAQAFFRIADHDGNGGISFSEAEASLQLDRAAFAVFDIDRDGRIVLPEFQQRYAAILERGGVFPPPRPHLGTAPRGQLDLQGLLDTYDSDRDRSLGEQETARALAERGVTDLEAGELLRRLDRDHDGRLSGTELEELLAVLAPGSAPLRARPRAASVEELFGAPEPRPQGPGLVLQPPRIPGPVPVFRRLDLDGDGGISITDLIELQRPLQPPVRVHAVLATLDLDGDGRVDRREFELALRAGGR